MLPLLASHGLVFECTFPGKLLDELGVGLTDAPEALASTDGSTLFQQERAPLGVEDGGVGICGS